MRNTLYYGELAAKISSKFHSNPDHSLRIEKLVEGENTSGDTIHSVAADAAKVFETIEELSGEHFVDWHRASDLYAQDMLDFLLMGRKPHITDMVSIAAHSIRISL